jgi:hypothetical protein
MAWNLALAALGAVFVLAAVLSVLGTLSRTKATAPHTLEGYLLAGASLGRASVVSLLLSSSFGLNALFYQVWLGYTVGAWGLVAQGAWALSFVLLAPYTATIRSQRSLHGLLGHRFGAATRVVAGACSIVGIMYLLGWEAGVGKYMFAGLLGSAGGFTPDHASAGAAWLTVGVVLGCLLYTVLGGLRGNASADLLLNALKLVAVFALTVLLLTRDGAPAGPSFWAAMLPSVEKMKSDLGWWGLLTNIAFSLAWQFVDTSTWQSVIAGAHKDPKDSSRNLRWSAVSIFIAPGIIGTILGVSLAGSPDINPENILARAVALAPAYDGIVLFMAFVTLVACVMSLIDGLLLAAAYALVVDILHPRKSLSELDAEPSKAERLVAFVRVVLLAIGMTAVWGVQLLLAALEVSLFDFLYIVIITQLALIGPVLAALLLSTRAVRAPMWLPILLALIVGFGSVAAGTAFTAKWLIDGAGTFTILTSCAVTLVSVRPAQLARREVNGRAE